MGRVARSSAIKMDFSSEIGAQAPLGFWDPLGLLANADQARFDRLRGLAAVGRQTTGRHGPPGG